MLSANRRLVIFLPPLLNFQDQQFVLFSSGYLDLSANILISGMVLYAVKKPSVAYHLTGLRVFCSIAQVSQAATRKYGYDKGVHKCHL